LIYISDLSWTKKIKHPSEFLSLEDKIEVVILDLDVDGRKLSLGHKQTKPNPWDNYEKDFALDTVHKSEISEVIDKGAIINFNEDISAFCPTRHLDKKDGSKLTEGETAEFKVIEFSKEFKRVVVSHMQTHNDSSPEEIVEEKVKEKKSKKKDEE
jgi:small subunit ribosomal protein S1